MVAVGNPKQLVERLTDHHLAKRSPTMLKVALEQLRRGAALGLADCFRMEYTLVQSCFEQGDFLRRVEASIH